jgi:hypothetical protein
MKHLKLFELWDSEISEGTYAGGPEYEKIGTEEANDIINNSVDISDRYFEEVKRIFSPIMSMTTLKDYYKRNKIPKNERNSSSPGIVRLSRKEIYIFTIFLNSISIVKSDDDWWLVNIPELRTWHKDKENPWCYYKCDQLYGLEKFYENELFSILNNNNQKRVDNLPSMIRLKNQEKFPEFPWK